MVALLALTVGGVAPLRPALAQGAPPAGPSAPTLPTPGLTGEAAIAGNPVPDVPPAVVDPASALPSPPPIPRPKPGEELFDRRTAASKTFVGEEPGQLRTTVFQAPVHFKDPQGRWVDIDDALGAPKDGRRRNGANVFGLSIAENSTDRALARLAIDDRHSVGFALDGAAEVKAKGDTKSVTYAKVRKDTDLRLTSLRSGVKEELVLASPAAPDRFVFPLELKGLTASLDEAGNVIYRDGAGVERARTPHGFMTDARIDPRSGESEMSLGVDYALIPWKGGTALEVRLDRAWLDDPGRQYPVTVDPDIHHAAWGDDTYVMSGFYRDNSYDAELKVGTYDGGYHIGRSFVRFDTGAFAGATVQHAEMHLAERHSWNCGYWPEHAYRVTGGWNGRNMPDWSNQPPVDPNGVGGTWEGTICGSRTAKWNVTGMAATWAAAGQPEASVSLRATNESDNNRWKKYASTEAGAPPALHVWYQRPPAIASGVTPANHTVFGTPTTSVSAVYGHPDGVAGQLAFGVWNLQNQLVWSQWSGSLCSGCRATYNVPALPDNWYYVMVIGWDGSQYSGGNAAPTWSPQQWFFIDTLAPAFPSSLTPASGATAGSPVPVSAVYSEPYGFAGRVIFQVNNAAGQMAVPQAVSGYVGSGQTATATMAPLSPGSYTLYAWSYDDRQLAGWTGGWAFTVAAKPGAPANITARGEPASAHVSWGAVAANGSPVSSVTVTARDTASGATTTKTCTPCVDSSAMVYDGLTPGRSYQFWAAAANAIGAGPAVGPSNTVQPQELSVLTPLIESVVAGDREVALTWSYLLDLPLVTTFYVQAHVENQGPIGPPVAVPAPLTGDLFKASYTYGGLRNGTPVYFTVSANILGLIQGPASPPSATVVPAGVPFKPGTPQAQPRDGKVLLSWTAPSSQVDGTPGNNGATIDSYEVTVFTQPEQVVKTVTVPAPVPDTSAVASFEVTDLTNLTAYYFKVRAHNAKGFGGSSDPSATVTPVPAPTAPTDVVAAAQNGQAVVSWTGSDTAVAPVSSYRVVASPGSRTATSDSATTTVTVTGLSNGTAYSFRVVAINDSGETTSEPSNSITPWAPLQAASTSLAEGRNHSLVVQTDGRVFAWGSNGSGELGDGTTTDQKTGGVLVTGLTDSVSVAAGDTHSVALRSDGTVLVWGGNGSGQLARSGRSMSSTALPVPGLDSIAAVAAGARHSLALRSDGVVLAWGANGSRQLGNDSNGTAVVQVPGLSDVIAIAAAGNYSMALGRDGSVWGWGDNGTGQVGAGSTVIASPTMFGVTGAKAIAAGLGHGLAVKTDGSVWGWGDNRSGQLGSGEVGGTFTAPVRVQSLQNPRFIAAGDRHSVAVDATGNAWAWGADDKSQLGDNLVNSPGNSPLPVQVLQSGANQGPLGDVIAIAAYGDHAMALTASDLRIWGAHFLAGNCIVADPKTTERPVRVPTKLIVPAIALATAAVILSRLSNDPDCGTPLFHYTSPASALGIQFSRTIFAAGNAPGYPSGAYATSIPPNANMTQEELKLHLFGPRSGKDVSAFVAFCSNDNAFVQRANPSDFWLIEAPRGTPVPVNPRGAGTTAMPKQ